MGVCMYEGYVCMYGCMYIMHRYVFMGCFLSHLQPSAEEAIFA